MTVPRFSAHIGYLFCEVALLERVKAARRAGFDAVEHPNPLSVDAAVMSSALRNAGLTFSQMGAASGDSTKGEKGLAALPGREQEFRDAIHRALDYAERIDCPFVHPMAGVAPASTADEIRRSEETYLANLAYAVDCCRNRSPRILIEAIGTAAVPGYFLSTLDKAASMASRVSPTDIHFLIDTFHAACNGEDLDAFISAEIGRIGHVHIADHPGRHEPGTGAIDFPALLVSLAANDYRGAIGFEYIPSRPTVETLSWLPSFKAANARPGA